MCTETSASLDYWFRVMDLDSDGFVSLADFHAFHMDTVVFLIQVSQPSCRGGAKLLKIVVVPNGFSYCLLKINLRKLFCVKEISLFVGYHGGCRSESTGSTDSTYVIRLNT